MIWTKPPPHVVWKAVEIYLALAYPETSPSLAVTSRLRTLEAGTDEDFYRSSALEAALPDKPGRYALRLGNSWYPCMKLVIEQTPGSDGYLFRADTHDRHIQPGPESKEYAAFKELMEKNQALSASIETAWEDQGLPTFKSFLRADLARRREE